MLAAIDLGSNSFRLHIGAFDGEQIRIVNSAREPVRLGAGLDERGNLTVSAMQSAVACLSRFSEILQATPLTRVRVVATNTVRIARNARTFLQIAEKAIGYPIEVISGEEEGRLIYMGVACALDDESERRLVIDIGGGSTELALGQGSEIEEVESFGIGTVSTASRFFGGQKITEHAFDSAILKARSYFEDGMKPFHPRLWNVAYGSSGTMRTIADVIEKNAIGDYTLSLKNMRILKDWLIACGRQDSIDLVGVKPERISVILGGLPVLIGLSEELGLKQLWPIEAGLRMGVLWDLHMRSRSKDRRRESIKRFLRRHGVDEQRAAAAKSNARTLYSQLNPEDEELTRMVSWAAQIHEVGMVVSHTGFHKHGAYLALHADLPGFTQHEQEVLSSLVLAQKGNLRKVSETIADTDLAKAVLALRLGIILMHARINPAEEEIKLRMRQRIDLELPKGTLSAHPTLAYWLGKEQASWEEVGIDFLVRPLV
jgi:exopolyphosphatase/guanosine-5'-triphosphate,3'-diphosphate pyrophosphatase